MLDRKELDRVYCMQQSGGGDNEDKLKRKEHRLSLKKNIFFSLNHSKMNVYMYMLDCLWACVCELRCLEFQKRALESLDLEVFCKLLTAESVPTPYKQMLFLLCFNCV